MDGKSAVIIAAAGPLRQGLRALLDTLPAMTLVSEEDEAISAIGSIASCQPDLVLVDLGLRDSLGWVVLALVPMLSPRTRCIALAGSVEEMERMRAQTSESVILKGSLATNLCSLISDLMGNGNGSDHMDQFSY